MVSCGPDVQNQSFTHMFTFVDYKCNNEQSAYEKGSLYDYLTKPEFSKFREIVNRANMIGFLSGCQADCTLFVPNNSVLGSIPMSFFQKMDDGYARDIVNASIIGRKIDKRLLISSPVSYFHTRNLAMRMYVTNINNHTKINNCVDVVNYDIMLNNGILHVVNGLIVPNESHFIN